MNTPHRLLRARVVSAAPTVEQRARLEAALVGTLAALAATALLCGSLNAGEGGGGARREAREMDERLNQARADAARRNALENANSAEERAKALKAMSAARDKQERAQNLAEFKEKTMNNLASVKEMFAKAEAAWKEKSYGQAAPLYSSIQYATVAGSEEMVQTSRDRMQELEDVSRAKLKAADDADLKRDYTKEIDELGFILKELNLTSGKEIALRRLANLKSKPDVAGLVEFAEAEGLEAEGKLSDAAAAYTSISNNPRYDNTIAGLKARRRIEQMGQNEETRAKLKTEHDAKADKEAPVLLGSAKNFLANKMPNQAIEKLQAVIDKYPESKYAEEARQKLAELK